MVLGDKRRGKKGLPRNMQEIPFVGAKGQQTLGTEYFLSLVLDQVWFFAGTSFSHGPCVWGALGNEGERTASMLGESKVERGQQLAAEVTRETK